MLKKQKPLVARDDSSSFQEKLASHDVVLAQGYNGQFAKAIKDAPDELAYVVPKEGGTFWMDNLCVPTSARHTASVDAFLAYVLQPEVSAKIAEGVGYGSPNAAARKLLKPEVLGNEVIYPPEDVLKRCKFMEDLGESAKLINQYVTEIRASRRAGHGLYSTLQTLVPPSRLLQPAQHFVILRLDLPAHVVVLLLARPASSARFSAVRTSASCSQVWTRSGRAG